MPGGGSQTQQTETEPWRVQQPYLAELFGEALRNYDAGTAPYYPGSTNVGFAPETELAQDWAVGRAIGGSPVEAAANRSVADTLSGEYLGANPNLTRVMDDVSGDIRSRMDAQFGGSGRYGSGMHQAATADALAQAEAELAYKNYGDERQGMLRTAFAAPQISGMDWNNLAQLYNVGDQRADLAQSYLNDDMARWNYYANAPYNDLGIYNQFIQGQYGGTGVTSGSGGGSRIGSALGGAGTGAVMGSMLAGGGGAAAGAEAGAAAGSIVPGWGTAIGAGLGLLAGLM